MDVDGTLTDGKIYVGLSGEVMKAFDVKDGYAIANILPGIGVEPVVITGRNSSIVAMRCEELGVKHVYQGVADKLDVLSRMLLDEGSSLSEVAYIGDDLNDLDCMKAVERAGGVAACPADAVSLVKKHSSYVSSYCGGSGAVRSIVEELAKCLA